MVNPLQSHLTKDNAKITYKKISEQLGMDLAIFDSMKQVASHQKFVIGILDSNASNAEKHSAISETLTQYFNLLERRGLLFELIEELHTNLVINGHQVHADRLRELAFINTNQNFGIRLSADCSWLNDWAVPTPDQPDPTHVLVTSFHSKWGNVVPSNVIQYINSGLLLYKQKQFAAALVLMSIGVEATLRDVLTKRYGYKNDALASKVDTYKHTRARVNVDGSNYTIEMVDPAPRSPSDLSVSAGGTLPVEIQIRRVINHRNNRLDLSILAPSFLVDHLSGDQKEKNGEPKSIGGLNDALKFAREVEKVITTSDLPDDVDDVLKAVRNSLVHLSGNSLDEKLPRYNNLKTTGDFTLRDFIDNPNMVYGFMTEIPEFIDREYVKLWKAGRHV